MTGSPEFPPVTGAWRAGNPPGRRQWLAVDRPLRLEAGELPACTIAYETWGRLNSDASNAVLVEHALTGDSHAAGAAGPGHPSPGWWDGLIGPGRALDTGELFVVVPNVLGGCQGTTGPSSPDPDGKYWGSRFPQVSVRDQVHAEAVLADALGIERWALVTGGSMGGMRALEWAATWPARVESLLVLAAPAASSAEQIAWASPQLHAIRSDPGWRGGDYYDAAPGDGPHRGLGIARRIAHVTYRSEPELAGRFGRRRQAPGDGRFAVESYLDHHADKIVRRFDANSYLLLTGSMNTHDVGRDRGGAGEALSRITARTLVAGVDSDRLYPLHQARELAAGIPGAGEAAVISSPYGHDSFLIETPQVAALVKSLLG
ncbi:homoserine O-acetyltransferase MetX [Amycolatopsis alkalitolerans]|uniref:Homoserine O-acetyltransferase n=1 Tax=Amycolatopsis alkalitolerans TaxID=2547244 RepID=A0A5C4LXC1_9PSEU|nr:homoserine O-acetyltransferase [Amycolatopsis alkalitolerans]TNC22738.1 homoserine O-acetyltransferase [Amycolatopsis alkalitolerans]